MPSARNAPNHSLFMQGMVGGQQVPLQEVPLNENVQKSGDRNNSFALYGKGKGSLNSSKLGQQSQINGSKRE